MRILAFTLLISLAGITLAAPQTQPQAREPEDVASEPSLAQIAQKSRQRRTGEGSKTVPLYTNDNLPKGTAGISILSSSNAAATARNNSAEEPASASAEGLPYLRYQLSQAQQRLRMNERELSVLQQKLSQSSMQYYPDPNKALLQEYSRQDINQLVQAVNQKKQEIAEDRKEIADLEDQIQRAQGATAFTGATAQAPQSALPPGIKPGTKAYWKARLAAAKQQVSTAQEEEKLAENELQLLKLQQLRTLDPNLQSNLAVRVSAKQSEIAAAKAAVEKAQQELEQVQKEMQASASQEASSK